MIAKFQWTPGDANYITITMRSKYNEKQVNGKVSNIDKHFIKSDHDEEEGESWGQEQLIF